MQTPAYSQNTPSSVRPDFIDEKASVTAKAQDQLSNTAALDARPRTREGKISDIISLIEGERERREKEREKREKREREEREREERERE